MDKGKLFLVATPIGNMGDITLRALETLKIANVILAEDTRRARQLFSYYEIPAPLIMRYDEHTHERGKKKILELLQKGDSVALITDAGTPAIADPGSRLVHFIHEADNDIPIIPIPGVSALITLLSVSGVLAERFTFLGYPPHKKGRKTFFETIKTLSIHPFVLYESPHRFLKTIGELQNIFGGEQKIVIGRELTKIHEQIFSGTLSEAEDYFKKNAPRGEFVLVVI